MDRGRVVELLKEALGNANSTDLPVLVFTGPVYITMQSNRGRKNNPKPGASAPTVRLSEHPSVTPLRQP